MPAQRLNSILIRSAIMLLASLVLVGLLSVGVTSMVTHDREYQSSAERLNQLIDTVTSAAQIACFTKDAKLAEEVAKGLLKNNEVSAVEITTASDSGEQAKMLYSARTGPPSPGGMHLVRPIHSPFDDQSTIGAIMIEANGSVIKEEIDEEVGFVMIQNTVQLLLIALTVNIVMLLFIVRPIRAMSNALHRMDATVGERLPRPRYHAGTEFGRLADDINKLAGDLVEALDQERLLRIEKEQGEKKYQSIFENAETGIFIAEHDGEISSWNPAFARLMDLPANENFIGELNIRQMPWLDPARIAEILLKSVFENASLDDELVMRQGDRGRWFHIVLTPIGNKQVQGVVHDVTEHRMAEENARQLAITDALTGCANRAGLEATLQAQLEDALAMSTGGFALIMLDLDGFKRINEGFGLAVGDAILKGVTSRLRNHIKSSDTLARLGGDRFVLLMRSVTDGQHLQAITARLLDEIRAPFQINGLPLAISASLGITVCPEDGQDSQQLLRHAELALDRAKAVGAGSSAFFTPQLAQAAEQRLLLEHDLRQAIARSEFELYYQPIVDLKENRLAGAEALIRWIHPERGTIAPDLFIPLAEEIGIINDIGLWVVESACAQLARWQGQGIGLYLSVNVSGRQIPDGLTPGQLQDAVAHFGIEPARLAIEITEGILLADIDKSLQWLRAVRDAGFRIYLDDFGTGYSSLSYLKRFPIDTLKIDKSFIRDMNVDSDDLALIEAVVAMAARLRLTVVAEGVETAAQLAILKAMDCRYAQGYHFSKPMPLAEFEASRERIDDQLSTAQPGQPASASA